MENKTSNVIEFTAIKKAFEKRQEKTGYCEHMSALLDLDNREVECRDCGRVIDAFDYLVGCMRKEERAFERYMFNIKEEARLNQTIMRLRRRIYNMEDIIRRNNNNSLRYFKKD